MMRIVVAGGGGLGYLLATQLSRAANAYSVVVLSRYHRPDFANLDVQIHQISDYNDLNQLAFALQGVDLVISTVSGRAQLNLIHAAVHGRVRLFVPSEFEGSVARRPSPPHADPLDRGSRQALALLRQSRIRYTVFSCGLFMERFHPCGLAYLNIGQGASIARPGDYLVDINRATAEFADRDARGRTVRVCLSSVYDVVRFLVAAIDLGTDRWPVEFTMYGDRMSLNELVDTCSRLRNGDRQTRSVAELQAYAAHHSRAGDSARAAYYHRLLATANGRYDFSHATLNDAIARSDLGEVQPLTLAQWLYSMLPSP
ncbi:isoflavone reductase family protein [Ophiocordyceps camponoti-floridani]|uniref:Isoflavone reductase family protein n=1 Tax=Ophiocordyceps camponoti-floridani TaxID=2030778 RepID=A0A8H4Q9W2_9HYPO|nr:isoflavone reductase family protein [Ophiocordyceps camponoti-floridani]